MTKDTEEFSQFSQFTDAVACPEYTLPRNADTFEPKGCIRGNTKIGPVLEVTTCCLQGKYGVEIRIMSVNKDNSHGLNKLVTNLNNNEQETSEVQLEEYALRLNASHFACRSKAKAKPQKRDFASSSTRTIPIRERTWTHVEPGKQSLSDYSVSKKLIHLLRHGSLLREDDGAIEFWRIKIIFRIILCIVIIGLTKSGRAVWPEEEETTKDFSIVLILQEQFCTSELSKGIQDAIAIDPSLQDNVIIPDGFFKYMLSRRMCHQFTFHHQFGIDTGRSKFEQQTDGILSACGSHGQRT